VLEYPLFKMFNGCLGRLVVGVLLLLLNGYVDIYKYGLYR